MEDRHQLIYQWNKFKKLFKYFAMDRVSKNKIYGNYSVVSPEGILMFKCNLKKVNWYLSRGLATIIQDDPTCIKLNFTPNGLGNHNRSYGLNKMENKCVNCGSTDKLTRHHIVPFCYRKFFPMEIKSHNFHDILPMCVNCHYNYERKADKLKELLAIQYNAPIHGLIVEDKSFYKFYKMAIILLRQDLNIPKYRILELRKSIKEKFGIKRLTIPRLKKISKSITKRHVTTHGDIIIKKINNNLFKNSLHPS